ncbi:MAG: ABC transporter permease [Gammaproteobacteria bacterium]|nr:ABC transporter permease [Gammaproteobacteria bacterium]MCP5199326.1 ABC transporter permease [Gammaproteobacteria bacterium]
MTLATRLAIAVLAAWITALAVAPAAADAVTAIDLTRMFEAPGVAAWMGTDDLGRSLAWRVVAGARVSLLVSAVVVTVTAAIGIAIGVTAAWLGGWIDLLLGRVIDVFLAFPGILLAIALAGVLGPGVGNVIIALGVVGWVGFARLARAQTLAVRERDHVAVARALGTPGFTIVYRHVLPLIAGPLVVEGTFALAAVIVAEAGLSFLGLGVQPPAPSWGSLIRDGTRYLLFAPHLVVMPGLALLSVVVAINLLGDRLRDRIQRGHRVGA